jgi:hypothetical protein
VIFLDEAMGHLYMAIGDPGVLQVVDVADRSHVDAVETEAGADTLVLDADHHRVLAFLPETHRAAVFVESES